VAKARFGQFHYGLSVDRIWRAIAGFRENVRRRRGSGIGEQHTDEFLRNLRSQPFCSAGSARAWLGA